MRYVIITKRGLSVICLATIIAISVIASLNKRSIDVAAVAGTERLPVYCVETDEKKIAVTFDAAWGADDIPQILEILNKHKAKATFFVVGKWVELYPESVKAIFKDGHEIGNHSYNHSLYSKLSADEISADVKKCNDAIFKVTGKNPSLFRFPSGDYSETAVKTVRSDNLQAIQWNVDSLDWQGLSKEEIIRRVVPSAENGSIILFHNDVKNTPEALDEVLSELSNKGYSFVTVSQLIYQKPYRIDAAGRQYKADS